MKYEYQGNELAIFEKADRWKAYWASQIRSWLSGNVLEVGAGIGANTQLLQKEEFRQWTCLEPDARLLEQIPGRLKTQRRHRMIVGTTAMLPKDYRADAILYIDVLEHIEHDAAELQHAAAHLNPGGALIVLSPAHQWLYSPFDVAIGHFRRYSKESLRGVAPPQLEEACVRYLDTAGIMTSFANRVLLRQSLPTQRQITTWDRWLVPVSTTVDPFLGYRVGKSVLGVWSRKA
jgi:SAM-dependent methyltransferase